MSAVPAIDTAARRCAVVLATGLLLPLAGCSGDGDEEPGGRSGAALDMAVVSRDRIAGGGTLRWAVDAFPTTLNTFQPDAGEATSRIAGATLPALFTLDSRARPQLNEDYLESAEITEREPRQTVVYELDPQAAWSDGRKIGVADFKAQWKALNGEDSAFWAARNAGYDRIAAVRKGPEPHQVEVTFDTPYADWKSLFTPLYPTSVTGEAEAFNESARTELPVVAGPFRVRKTDDEKGTVTLERNPRWWGTRARLDRIVLTAVPREKRERALAAGELDLAEIGPAVADRIGAAKLSQDKNPKPRKGRVPDAPDAPDASGASGASGGAEGGPPGRRPAGGAGRAAAVAERRNLDDFTVRKALDPAYTQLTLNGASGPLADERVRRAIARSLDRRALAKKALAGTGLPARALGSHLRAYDQNGYQDNSDALGGNNVESAQSLLAEAGWEAGGPVSSSEGAATPDAKKRGDEEDKKKGKKKEGEGEVEGTTTDDRPPGEAGAAGDAALPVSAAEAVRITGTPLSLAPDTAAQRAGLLGQLASARAREAEEAEGEKGQRTAEKAESAAETARERADEMGLLSRGHATAVRTKDGQPLALRFVVPAGPGSATIRATGERIARTLNGIGVRTEIVKVADESYFRDHIASGDFDLALYSWPTSAYPATDAEPIFAKPLPAPDGTLLMEQNYSRVGTDRIDQLFEQASSELDDEERLELLRDADAHIWAAAGSVPLYQRPQLVATRKNLANAGAFGFQTPRYQDIGFRK